MIQRTWAPSLQNIGEMKSVERTRRHSGFGRVMPVEKHRGKTGPGGCFSGGSVRPQVGIDPRCHWDGVKRIMIKDCGSYLPTFFRAWKVGQPTQRHPRYGCVPQTEMDYLNRNLTIRKLQMARWWTRH